MYFCFPPPVATIQHTEQLSSCCAKSYTDALATSPRGFIPLHAHNTISSVIKSPNKKTIIYNAIYDFFSR